jgi:hypothetical protein
VPVLVAKKIEIGAESAVEACLEEFGHGPVFEEWTPQRMGGQMGGLADANQRRGEAGSAGVELGVEEELRGLKPAFARCGRERCRTDVMWCVGSRWSM